MFSRTVSVWEDEKVMEMDSGWEDEKVMEMDSGDSSTTV